LRGRDKRKFGNTSLVAGARCAKVAEILFHGACLLAVVATDGVLKFSKNEGRVDVSRSCGTNTRKKWKLEVLLRVAVGGLFALPSERGFSLGIIFRRKGEGRHSNLSEGKWIE
jgi:hypothetical protein